MTQPRSGRFVLRAAVLAGALTPASHQPLRAETTSNVPTTNVVLEAQAKPVWQSVTGHSIRYLVSLPKSWSLKRKWPVIVVITGSNSNFPIIGQGYHDRRGDKPFILVTPATVSSGSKIIAERYPHLAADELARLAAATAPEKLAYDMAGLERIVAEGGEMFGGEAKVYLSGFSMGGTLAWEMALRHSDRLHLVFPVCAVYDEAAGVLIPDGHRAANPVLPIQAFQGDKDKGLEMFNQHWERASALAKKVGFQNVTRTVTGRGHSWYYEEILQICTEHHARRQGAAAPATAVQPEPRP